ncbi:MAG: glycosyltransferase [Deltaproteobacteria bacterium]|nr:glycosyltransferase [Deltaproteobacteria bacterium]
MDASLIIPIFKAESFLEGTLKAVSSHLSTSTLNWELLLVLDASPDRSKLICEAFAKRKHPFTVRVLENSTNMGKGATVKAGMLAARGRYRMFTDCDLAYPMSEVEKVFESLKNGADIAIASRTHDESNYLFSTHKVSKIYKRHFISRSFNLFVNAILPLNHKDTQAGLKGFRSEVADYLFSQSKLQGFSFDVEILYLAQNAGLNIQEVGISYHHRDISTINFSREGFRMVRDIFKIRYWKLRKQYSDFISTNSIEEINPTCG